MSCRPGWVAHSDKCTVVLQAVSYAHLHGLESECPCMGDGTLNYAPCAKVVTYNEYPALLAQKHDVREEPIPLSLRYCV